MHSRSFSLGSLGRTVFVGSCGLISISIALALLSFLVGLILFATGFLPLNG
jgi:hypothetical protein